MEQYREEFLQFFPTVLGILMNRRKSHPRAKLAYDHLEEVKSFTVVVHYKEQASCTILSQSKVCAG